MVRKAWETQPKDRRTVSQRAETRRGSRLTAKRHTRDKGAAPVVPLPVLRPNPTDFAGVPVEAPREPSLAERIVTGVSRWLWRHRTQTLPFIAGAATLAGAVSNPAATTLALGALAGAAHYAVKRFPDTIAGRPWLSAREREIAAWWFSGAAAWSTAHALDAFDLDIVGATLLGVAVAKQTRDWIASRRVRRADNSTDAKTAGEIVMAWPVHIGGKDAPPALRGSHVLPDTMEQPDPGTYAFAVELADHVHAETAVTEDARRFIERRLHMPIATAELTVDRDDAAIVRVALTPTRQLENISKAWSGPTLNPDGTFPLAVTRDGRTIHIALYNEGGAEHIIIGGGTNTGKSYTAGVVIAPGVNAGLDVVWYIDGGDGASAPHLAHAVDWWAGKNTDEWARMIAAAHDVMQERARRREAAGDGPWNPEDSTDPMITLVIDEAAKAKAKMTARDEQRVTNLVTNGRKHGMRVVQITQDLGMDSIIGGRIAGDNLMAGGSTIGHRVGSHTASSIAAKGTIVPLRLNGLPQEPGWIGVYRRGDVLAEAARVYDTGRKGALFVERMGGTTLRALNSHDATAAGDAYTGRETGPQAANRHARVRADRQAATQRGEAWTPSTPDEGGKVVDMATHAAAKREKARSAAADAAAGTARLNQMTIEVTLRQHPDGLNLNQLRETTGIGKSTLRRHIDDVLVPEGRVVKHATPGGANLYRVAPPAIETGTDH